MRNQQVTYVKEFRRTERVGLLVTPVIPQHSSVVFIVVNMASTVVMLSGLGHWTGFHQHFSGRRSGS